MDDILLITSRRTGAVAITASWSFAGNAEGYDVPDPTSAPT